jgi:hypothetical protein
MSEFLPIIKIGRDIDNGGFDYAISMSSLSQAEYEEIVVMTHWALVNLQDYIRLDYTPAGASK